MDTIKDRIATAMIPLLLGAVLGIPVGAVAALNGSEYQATIVTRSAQPYGGCKEAWQAPRSDGAKWCRQHGWTVTRRVVLNPHGVIRYWNLRSCKFEDGSGTPLPCGWLGQRDGNGYGLSYYVTGDKAGRHYHYVWPTSPLVKHPAREWVSRSLADALAEGSAPDATTRNWRHCWVKGTGRRTVVGCPDGHREEWKS